MTEAYMLNRDEDESKRLNWQHHWIKGIADNKLIHPSIPLDCIRTVADVATGTGVWIRDLATNWHGENKPEFFAFDVSPNQFPKDNDLSGIRFCIHDVTQPFPEEYHGRFDLVNVRLMSYAIKISDLQAVINNLAAILRPKGYLNWQECDILDAWADPPSETARSAQRLVINERLARGLTPAIAYPLLKSLCAPSINLHNDMVNPMSWTGNLLRILQLHTVSTREHPQAVVRENTSHVITTTIASLLRSGAERRLTDLGKEKPTGAEKEISIAEEMLRLAEVLGSDSGDTGSSTWNCEMTWIVAQKAIAHPSNDNWMSARYGK